MIEVIIFDCWKTLFEQNLKTRPFEAFANKIGFSMKDYEYKKLFEKVFMTNVYSDYSQPIIRLLDELGISKNEAELDELVDIIKQNKEGIVPFDNIFKVLENLKKQYRLMILSNAEAMAFEVLKTKYDIEKYFEKIYTSYETGYIKPDPMAFKVILEDLSIAPQHILMVGDSMKDDIEAAGKLGSQTMLIDRNDKYPDVSNKIKSLNELEAKI